MPKAGRDDDGSRDAFLSGVRQDLRHGRRWRRDDDDVRDVLQFFDALDRRQPADFRMPVIDHIDRAGEAGVAQVFQDGPPERALPGAPADERKRTRRKQRIEPINAHATNTFARLRVCSGVPDASMCFQPIALKS